jgi:hypothetical protein
MTVSVPVLSQSLLPSKQPSALEKARTCFLLDFYVPISHSTKKKKTLGV